MFESQQVMYMYTEFDGRLCLTSDSNNPHVLNGNTKAVQVTVLRISQDGKIESMWVNPNKRTW